MLRLKATSILLFITLLGSVSFAQAQDKVSDAELNKFAIAFQEVQTENQKVQEEMKALITDNGLEVQRFSAIQQQTTNPDQEVDATKEEKESFKMIMGEITKMQPMIEARMGGVVTDAGMTVERFQAIGNSLQTDQELQQRLQAIMVAKTTEN